MIEDKGVRLEAAIITALMAFVALSYFASWLH